MGGRRGLIFQHPCSHKEREGAKLPSPEASGEGSGVRANPEAHGRDARATNREGLGVRANPEAHGRDARATNREGLGRRTKKVPTTALTLLLFTLVACESPAPAPSPEQFQFPMAVYVQSSPHEYWEAVERGLKSRLNEPGMSVEWQFFNADTRETVRKQSTEAEYRAVALTALPSDSWAREWVQTLVQEQGTPVVLLGTNIPDALDLGFVGTYYYEVGRRAGSWFARNLARGEVLVVASHPVPRAVSEFWDGFRHGLMTNRRLRPQLVAIDRRTDIPARIETLTQRRSPAGIFFMGHDVAQEGLSALQASKIGVLSWNEDALGWFQSGKCQLLALEQPEEVGVRAGNLLRNLSQGRGRDRTVVYVPAKWYTR